MKTLITIMTFILAIGCASSVFKNADKHEIVYVVDSLKIPKCELCDTLHMKRNILFSNEINLKDEIILGDSLIYIVRSNGDTLSVNHYMIRDSIFEIYGFDWIDYATILEKSDNKMILKKSQRVTYRVGQAFPQNDLYIYTSTKN